MNKKILYAGAGILAGACACMLGGCGKETAVYDKEIYCRSIFDAALDKKVTDAEQIETFTKMLASCQVKTLTEEESAQAEWSPAADGYAFQMSDKYFYLNEKGYYLQYYLQNGYVVNDSLCILEGFDAEVFQSFVAARHG